jgi:outer membrane protein assembly factor BamA
MTVKRQGFFCRLLLLFAFTLLCSQAFGQVQPDTTKEREPYPESRSTFSDIWAVPQYIIDIPINVLEGASGFLIEDLYGGLLAAQVAALIGNFDRIWGFYPVFSTGGRSGFEYGIGFRSKGVFTREERLKIKGTYSSHDYQNLKIQYRAPNFIDPDVGITFLGQYRKRPWEGFYGLGNNSNENSQVNYNPEQSQFRAGGLWTINHSWKLEFIGGYGAINIYDGEDPNLEGKINSIVSFLSLSPDDVRSTRLWSLGGVVDHDWRNNNGQPTSGGREVVSLTYNKSTRDYDELEYWHLSVDLRHYLELFKKRTLAFRVLVESLDKTDNSPAVPFYLKSQLGGVDNLRGYRGGRFIDNDMTLASVEYRYPLLERIDAFLFLDEGRVFTNLSNDFKWHDWKYSYGGGIRLCNREDLMFRTFIAKSKEDTRVSLEFSDSF